MRRALDRERAARVFGSEGRWRHVVERCGGVRARVRWSGVVSARRDLVFVRLFRWIFELKESTQIVAECLKLTKYAVYKYLREFRETNGTGNS